MPDLLVPHLLDALAPDCELASTEVLWAAPAHTKTKVLADLNHCCSGVLRHRGSKVVTNAPQHLYYTMLCKHPLAVASSVNSIPEAAPNLL